MLIQMKTVTDQTSADREKAQIEANADRERAQLEATHYRQQALRKKRPRLIRLLVSGSSSLWSTS